MKNMGLTLIIIGFLGLLFSYNMKTTVTTDAKYYGYGIEVPSMTVNNLGLMEDRRNALILSSVITIVGAILYAAGAVQVSKARPFESTVYRGQPTSTTSERKCPYCAEHIRSEAIICRFCNRSLNDLEESGGDIASISAEELAKYRNDPDKLMTLYGIKRDGNIYEYRGKYFERPYDAIAHAELTSIKESLGKSLRSLS